MKGAMHVTGSREIKSIHSAGVHSIPKVQRSIYLELFRLKREKDKLEQEVFALDKRRRRASMQLGSVDRRIEKLRKETEEDQKLETGRRRSAGRLRTMAMHY